MDRIKNARDRSGTTRCTEFQNVWCPTGWSAPVVLAWEAWPDVTVTHLQQFADGCWKSCIQAQPGTTRPLPFTCWLAFYRTDHINYAELQLLEPTKDLWMMCGGKSWYSHVKGSWIYDALYWTEEDINMPPSCGRVMAIADLYNSDCDWVRKPKSKCWFCPACDAAFRNGC